MKIPLPVLHSTVRNERWKKRRPIAAHRVVIFISCFSFRCCCRCSFCETEYRKYFTWKNYERNAHHIKFFNTFCKWNFYGFFITARATFVEIKKKTFDGRDETVVSCLPPWLVYMIHFIFNSTRRIFFLPWKIFDGRRFERGASDGGKTGWEKAKYIYSSCRMRRIICCVAICMLLFFKCLKVMVSPSLLGRWLLRMEWQIIWLFIMNCHVPQGNYINYLTERRFCCSARRRNIIASLRGFYRHFTSCPIYFSVSEFNPEIIKQQIIKYCNESGVESASKDSFYWNK